MRISVLNYIESTDTLVLMCDGHLITHVSGKRPEELNNAQHRDPDVENWCDRDICLTLLYAECQGGSPADMVGMSIEHVEDRPSVRFTGHTGGLISYTFDGQEKHIHIDSLAVLHLKLVSGDDMSVSLENDLLACAYETFILNGNTATIIGREVTEKDLERG